MTDRVEPASAEMPTAWSDLLVALRLLAECPTDTVSPLHCEHDTLTVLADPSRFTAEELARLDRLGFFPTSDGSAFQSFRFGSA